MKFRIEVQEKRRSTLLPANWETYDKEEVVDEATARLFAEQTLEYFNSTLRTGELPRVFTGRVELLGEGTKQHRWRKLNSVTQMDHHGMFDRMECERCGAKARRYGLMSLKRTKPYDGKKYEHCPGKVLYG